MQLHVLCLGPLFTNCCIVGNADGQAYIIDPANDADRIIDVIDTAGLTPRAVLLTHAHFDHIAALPAVASRYDLPVWLDPDDLPVYESPMNCFPPEIPAVERLPDTVSELDIAIDGLDYEILRTPGHSPGSVGFYFPGHKMLIGGDTLFQSSIGRSDLPLGDGELLLHSIRTVLYKLPSETIVHPGHGPATTIGQEMLTNPFVRAE